MAAAVVVLGGRRQVAVAAANRSANDNERSNEPGDGTVVLPAARPSTVPLVSCVASRTSLASFFSSSHIMVNLDRSSFIITITYITKLQEVRIIPFMQIKFLAKRHS